MDFMAGIFCLPPPGKNHYPYGKCPKKGFHMSLHMGSTENALKELERQRSREVWKAALGAFLVMAFIYVVIPVILIICFGDLKNP